VAKAQPKDSRVPAERSKWLLRLIWVRLGVFSVFVVAEASREPSSDLLVLLGAVYALSFCWFALLRLNKQHVGQAYAQIAVDLLLITWMVNRTGGIDSYFSSLYFLEIVMSSILLRRRGASATAAVSALLHGVHLDLAHFRVIPSTTTTFPELFTLQYTVGLTIFGFCAVGFLSDFLAEKWHASNEALKESTGQVAFLQALTSHIIDSLGSGLITTDLEGRIYLFNPAAARLLGRSSEEAVGLRIGDLFPILPEAAEVGHFEITIPTANRTATCLQFSVTPLTMNVNTPTGYVWSFDDVTELRGMERELRRKERMAAIGAMSAGIAHEIRNPLASITGSFDLLQSGLKLGEEQQQLVEIISRETRRLNQTIRDFLLYARPVVPRPKPVYLESLISDAVQLMRNSTDLEPTHRIETDLEPVTANVDEDMMRQVFYNLASNAFRAMPDSGTLRITLRGGDNTAQILFEDSGVGMTNQQIDRLFLPFTSSFPRGTGLGLSIVYQIVNSHHGSISVKSKVAKGTTFTLNLPRTFERVEDDQPSVEDAYEEARAVRGA